MRHRALLLVGVAILTLLPLTVSGCWVACGCLLTPDPNWTAAPLNAQEAASAAAKFGAGTGTLPTDLVASLVYTSDAHPYYVVSGPTSRGVVDARGGLVLEWVVVDSLPDSSDVVVSTPDAQNRAATYLSDRGWSTDSMNPATTLRPGGGVTTYVVTWAGQGFDAPGMSVLVNPSSGTVFAFVDEREGVQLTAPSIGAAEAGKLALAASPTAGLVVLSTNLQFDLGQPSWTVSLGSADTIGSAPPTHGAVLTVDAVTGATTVGETY
jgi:hypothetical protein